MPCGRWALYGDGQRWLLAGVATGQRPHAVAGLARPDTHRYDVADSGRDGRPGGRLGGGSTGACDQGRKDGEHAD